MRIDHYREPCWAVGPSLCLRILDSSDPQPPPAHDIDGFEYEWGYVYEVVVDVHEVSHPAADSSSVDYALVEVVAREPVEAGAAFSLDLTADYVARVDNDDLQLVGGLAVECAEPAVCATIVDAMRSDIPFRLEVSHPIEPGDAFVAHGVAMLDAE